MESLPALNLRFLLQTFNRNTFKQRKSSQIIYIPSERSTNNGSRFAAASIVASAKTCRIFIPNQHFLQGNLTAGLSPCSELLALNTLPSFCIHNEANRTKNKNFYKQERQTKTRKKCEVWHPTFTQQKNIMQFLSSFFCFIHCC